MKGTIFHVPVTGLVTMKKVTDPNVLTILKEIVGGYIEIVPYFNTYVYNGVKRPCVAFCNEEGKLQDLPINRRATLYWINAVAQPINDVLVGDIAIVIGDEEFLGSL